MNCKKKSLRGVSWNNEKLLIDSARKIIHDKFTFTRAHPLVCVLEVAARQPIYIFTLARLLVGFIFLHSYALALSDYTTNGFKFYSLFPMHHPICIPSIQHRTHRSSVFVWQLISSELRSLKILHTNNMVVRVHWNWSASLSPISTLIQ